MAKKYSSKDIAAKLLRDAMPFAPLFYVAVFFMLFSALANIFPSWLVKVSIDGLAALETGLKEFSILPSQVQNYATSLGLASFEFKLATANLYFVLPFSIVAVFTMDACFKFLFQYSIRQLGLKLAKSIREKFHLHINHLSLQTQSKYDSGSMVSVITSDMINLQNWVAESTMNLFNDGFKALFLFAWLCAIDWRLTIISLISIPLFAIPVLYIGKKIRHYIKGGQDNIGSITSFSTESLLNQKAVKAYNLQDWRQKNFLIESNSLFDKQSKWVLFTSLVSPLTNIIAAAGIATILFMGLRSVTEGVISVGEFSSFFVTSILLYDPMKRIGRVSTIIQSALGTAERVYGFLDEQVQEDTKTTQARTILSGDIEFKNISYSYKDADLREQKLFDGLDLKIPALSSLALVGPSGSGKTTLASLLPRFYEINSGEIKLANTNIKDLSLKNLRENITIITQDPLLFTGSIKDNILLSAPKSLSTAELETRLEQASQAAFVTDFTKGLEQGLDTHIGERGQNLSVGQRQRVALSRAFISDAPVVIFDEPTSALDNESQAFIYKSMQELMKIKTVIIIAHRLSTIENCDQIVYLENGKILEQGKHKELLDKQGLYAQLSS